MNTGFIGQKLPNVDGRSKFFTLKDIGQSFTFRFAYTKATCDGVHFMEDITGEKSYQNCPRITNGEECEICNKFFEIKREIKEQKLVGAEKEEKDKEARKYSPKINFYYAVLNRETGESGIFKTTTGVRGKLDQEVVNGIDVYKYDYKIRRNGGSIPQNFYGFTRVDSLETKPLTEEETAKLEEMKSWDITTMVNSKPRTSGVGGDIDINSLPSLDEMGL